MTNSMNAKGHEAHASLPMLSLVIAAKNASETLAACLESFYDQDYPHKQLVLIDGASTDDTVAIAKKWLSPRDRILSEPDSGVYDAWNKAIPLCEGEWISFLGADDVLPDSDTYSRVARYISLAPSATEILYGNVALTNVQGETLLTFGQPWASVSRRHKAGGTLPHPGSMHRKTLFDRVGSFDTSFRIAGDYELQLRALKGREPIYMPDITTALHRIGGISGEANELLAIKEVARARRKNGLWLPSKKITINFLYSLARQRLVNIFGTSRTYKFLDAVRRVLGRSPYWTKN